MCVGDLLLNTGTVSVGGSGALDIRSGLSASGSGGSIAFSVGSDTNIGWALSVMADNISGAAGFFPSTVSGLSSTSSGKSLTLASGDGNTSGGAVTIDGGNGSTASGGSITISLGFGTATSSGSIVVLTSNKGTAGVLGDLSLNTVPASIGNSGALDIGSGLSAHSSVAISVGSGTNIGRAFSVMAGILSGAA